MGNRREHSIGCITKELCIESRLENRFDICIETVDTCQGSLGEPPRACSSPAFGGAVRVLLGKAELGKQTDEEEGISREIVPVSPRGLPFPSAHVRSRACQSICTWLLGFLQVLKKHVQCCLT